MKYSFKKIIVFFLIMALSFYIASCYYNYYFDLSNPVITCEGIENEQHYNGNIQIKINGSDAYKIKNFSVYLDEKLLINQQSVKNATLEFPLLIPTIHLANGKHSLRITMVDAAKNQNGSALNINFFVDNEPLEISIIKESDFKINQGNTLHVLLQSNKILKKAYLKTLMYTVPIVLESHYSTIYEAFAPISTDEVPGKYIATIYAEDFVGNIATTEIEYEVLMTLFKKQYIELKNKKNKSEENLYNSCTEIDEAIKKATELSPANKLWHGSFYKPCVQSPITTEFGVIRTSYERGRYRHDAVDFGARPKSPVWACQDGIIIIKDPNRSGFGNCVAIDHGCGLISIYGHLDSFGQIEIGQKIKKGTVLGSVGMTGYATGYHLHWEMRLCNVKINPLEWVKNDIN